MASKYSTSTVDRTWLYLNQACQWALRQRQIKTNPAADVLLPAARPAKARKSLTIKQAEALLVAIPDSSRPAMRLTGLMCGLRPGELAGLRWPFVDIDIDSDNPGIEVAERAVEIASRYVGQGEPKTARGRRRIGLHPLLVAALIRHQDELTLLGHYDDEGFVFCTRKATPISLSSLRRGFKDLCEQAGLGREPRERGSRDRERRLDFRPMYCHCDYMPELKEERLQIRVNPAEKRLLEQAAQSAHLSVSAFVLQAASHQAEQLLAERQTITLTPEAATAFAKALAEPAAVNERLRAALRRPRKFRWID
jgi:uncharacterized protein (DUF1778 family)